MQIKSRVLIACARTTGCRSAGKRTEIPSIAFLHTLAIAARVVKRFQSRFCKNAIATHSPSKPELSAFCASFKIVPKSGLPPSSTRPRVGSR